MHIISKLKHYIFHLAFLQSLVASLGSIYIGEVLQFYPCALCWYQRLCMFPLPIILGIGLYKKDKNSLIYAFPFSLAGLALAAYHSALYYSTPVETAYTCGLGESCTMRFGGIFEIFPIPVMSWAAFAIISASIGYLLVKHKRQA